MNAYLNSYQHNQVATASREQVLIMLYDGAIRFTREATQAMAAGNRALKVEKLNRLSAIISELSATLDHEIGGEIAENLDALYGFMSRELMRGNLQNDPEPLGVVEKLLVDLRETWAQAIVIYRQELADAAGKAAATVPAGHRTLSASL